MLPESCYMFRLPGERCQWGAKNGNRLKNEKRNQEIRQLYKNGFSLEQLSARFFLTPESIKNILYTKKGTKMNLDEILKLYDDAPPLAVEKMYQVDERKTWGEYYYIADYLVTFPKRKLMLHIHCYPYTTPARIEEQNKTAAPIKKPDAASAALFPIKPVRFRAVFPLTGTTVLCLPRNIGKRQFRFSIKHRNCRMAGMFIRMSF